MRQNPNSVNKTDVLQLTVVIKKKCKEVYLEVRKAKDVKAAALKLLGP